MCVACVYEVGGGVGEVCYFVCVCAVVMTAMTIDNDRNNKKLVKWNL